MTPTALHNAGIYIANFIHWNTGIKYMAMHILIFVTANEFIREICMVNN